MKKLCAIFLILILVANVIACTNHKNDEEGFTVGYVISNFGDTFQNFIFQAMEAYAHENGVMIISADANESMITQINIVENLIARGVDALIVVPVDTSAMKPITRMAQEAEIPLVYVNRNPFAGSENQMPEGVFYVGSQEIEAGIMQAEYIGPLLNGVGGIGILQGILSNEGAIMRTEGSRKTIQEQFPGIAILSIEPAEWQTDIALDVTENWITTFGHQLNAILSNNDDMALVQRPS